MTRNISFQEAVELAKSGNAEAQYALSSVLSKRRQFDECVHWLRRAAAQNFIPARLTLAIFLADGRHCPRDRQQANDLLRPLASEHPQASLLLSELYGFAAHGTADRLAGLRYLFAAARMGEPGALRQLGLLSLCHRKMEWGRWLLDAANRRGDAAAACALASHHLPEFGNASDRASLGIDWLALEQGLPDLAMDLPLPNFRELHAAPLIRLLPGVIHPLVLDTVINLAAPLVQRSQIVDARTGAPRADPMRSSSHVTLGPQQHDHVLEALERCISRVTGLPVCNGEFLQILRYRRGEEFKPHVDYFNESGAGAYKSLADGGQRAQTVLLYLNDGYSGGHTSFPELRLVIQGVRGDMLHFHNLGADGTGHKDTLHAGMPVIDGEKWLLSQWIRGAAYPPRLAW